MWRNCDNAFENNGGDFMKVRRYFEEIEYIREAKDVTRITVLSMIAAIMLPIALMI